MAPPQGSWRRGRRRPRDWPPSLTAQVCARGLGRGARSLRLARPRGWVARAEGATRQAFLKFFSAVPFCLFFFSFCVISCPFGSWAGVVAGCRCHGLIFSKPCGSKHVPSIGNRAKAGGRYTPSPGTPQKSSTARSEGIFWWRLFPAGDLEPPG